MHIPLDTPRLLLSILKEALFRWWEDNAIKLAAAIAFYTVFSLAPLVIIVIAIAGSVFGTAAVQGDVVASIEDFVGREGAGVIQSIIVNARMSHSSSLAAALSILLLLVAATAVFAEIQQDLNSVWDVRSRRGIRGLAVRRLLSFLMVLGIGLLLLAMVLATTVLSLVGSYFGHIVPGLSRLLFFINFLLPFVALTVLFAMFYKVLPDVKISWLDVWAGATVTSLLFILGRYLLGFYFSSRTTFGSAYGAAGSLVVFLLWVYYSAQIFLFGAEVTYAQARHLGRAIMPARGAAPISGEC
jgi:membrane protein